MRKLLLFFFALLTGVGGAWAASPAAGAYPVEGKTYYLFANKYNSTDRYYLYWDNANSALKHAQANTKENTDYYKWTVTISDGLYVITNVGTGTSLKWNSGLTLAATGSSFDLSKDVNYTACVSLYTTDADGGRWLCVKNDTETFGDGYKYTSFGNYTDYSINFVFEEVLSAHSLTDGTYYTIYCDNDSKQYIWDNTSSLAVTNETPTSAALNCIWKCIVNGDYYNFQNLATGQYLGWKGRSSSAYNWTLETTDVYHDGCVKMKQSTASTYMGLGVGGAFDNASHGRFPKVTTDYSFDFRFDAITPSTSITTLPTANNKAYVITNARGTWNFSDDATSMSVADQAVTNFTTEAQQIALIYKDSEYYLFSVNAGKYLTASNTLTSMPTDAEQIEMVATSDDTYPWLFRFKNSVDENSKYTKNINVSGGVVKIDGWGPNGSNASGKIDEGNSNMIIEAADFDATAALQMFDIRTVTYNLSYGGNATLRTVTGVTATLSGAAEDFVPESFKNACVTLSCSPTTITSETTEVTVTATWNGPFQLSDSYATAKWYTVGIQSSYQDANHIWKYESSNSGKIAGPSVATDAFGTLTNDHLFCFVGNPYDGISIYNCSAGDAMTMYLGISNSTNDQAQMSTTGSLFIPAAPTNQTVADGYCCFKLKDDDHTCYLNSYGSNSYSVFGWNDTSQGSTCWFIPAGQYYLNFIDGLNLDAPVGAVGTKAYFTTVDNSSTIKSNISGYRTTIASNLYADVSSSNLGGFNGALNPIYNSETITLADGYYRIVNAYSNFATKPSIYYNSTSDKVEWSIASNASDNVNSIFKLTVETPSIYSPNAQKYMSVINSTVRGALAEEAGTTSFTSLGSAQYNILVGGGTMHAAEHSPEQSSGIYGTGTANTLTSWSGSVGSPSAWYIVKVDDLDLTLNAAGDGYYYATLCLPFDVTLTGCSAYTLTLNGAETALTLSDAITVVPAGTPVLLRGESASATANIAAAAAMSAPLTTTSLTGTYTDLTVTPDTDYFLGADNNVVGFYKWDGTTLKANRAYLAAGSLTPVKGFAINFDDADGIHAVEKGDLKADNGIYNLAGQRVSKAQKGIFIVHGKKIVK